VVHHLHTRKSKRFLTFNGLYFGHILCFRYPNGSCEPILNIYVPRTFQWYKELFTPMSWNLWSRSLKIRESIGTPTPKVGAHLRVWKFIPSYSPTLLRTWHVTLGLPSWLAPLQALALVVSPRLGLRHYYLTPLSLPYSMYFLYSLTNVFFPFVL